jgi:hypothetical protein
VICVVPVTDIASCRFIVNAKRCLVAREALRVASTQQKNVLA